MRTPPDIPKNRRSPDESYFRAGQDRWRISGMQIVENQHQRLHRPRVAQESGNRIEQAEPVGLRSRRRGRANIGQNLGDLGDDLCDQGGARSQLRPQLLAASAADAGPQRLHPRPVRGRTAGLPAPPPRHLDPTITGPRRRLTRQTALPNAGVSSEQEQPAAPGDYLVEPGEQFPQLAIPPDQCRCCPRPFLHPVPHLRPLMPIVTALAPPRKLARRFPPVSVRSHGASRPIPDSQWPLVNVGQERAWRCRSWAGELSAAVRLDRRARHRTAAWTLAGILTGHYPSARTRILIRDGVDLEPVVYGGGQEHGLRAEPRTSPWRSRSGPRRTWPPPAWPAGNPSVSPARTGLRADRRRPVRPASSSQRTRRR